MNVFSQSYLTTRQRALAESYDRCDSAYLRETVRINTEACQRLLEGSVAYQVCEDACRAAYFILEQRGEVS